MNGAFKLKGVQTVTYEMPTVVIPGKPVVVEVPTVAPEPVVVEVPTVAPEPVVVEVPTVAPEPVVSEVEAPAEVTETAPEAGLVPENPATE
jgi:hypothetical protein